MSTDGKSLPVHEMDTNLLFEKFTVDEIRNIEKRTRSDIERKKEDLRTMVGERYRDLIEAADTISEMKQSSLSVMSTIGKIETLCNDLKQSHMIRGSSLHQKRKLEIENRRKEEARFYGVAAQIKLLLDIPEKVWTCLDCEDFLSASRLYLLSQHINTSLHLDSQNSPNFLYWFPVLNRQWAAISHFKSTILQGCRRLLKEPNVPDKKIAESLCSILLLENSNPRQVFNEFLLARTGAVQQLFHASNESASTKDQICTVVQLITTTIHQIHTVFYNQENSTGGTEEGRQDTCNLLLRILTEVTSQKQCESGLLDLQGSVSARCLPKSVSDFCPSHKSVSMGVSEQHLHDNCKQWIQTCSNDVKAGVGKLLNFVNTVKHLATIRDTVWELMAKDTNLEDWPSVCERVLSMTLNIWEDLLEPLFVGRVKALIKYQLETSVEITERQITKVLTELDNSPEGAVNAEVDLASYIWSESPSDIAANTAWGSSGSRSLLESGGLMMKAKAFTPVTQSLCKTFDEKLKFMYEDCKFYLFTDKEMLTVTMETKPFNRFANTADLLTYIQESCVQGVNRMLKFLSDLKTDCEKTLSAADRRCTRTGNKLLLAGRLCAAMCELTVHLQQCMMGGELLQRQDRSAVKKSTSGRLSKLEVCTIWETMKARLTDFQKSAYRLWVDHLVRVALTQFSTAAKSQTYQEVIRTSARWDEVSIEEETEDGKKVSSKICVPMQASWYLLSLLYGLCGDLNQIGGHSVAREVLEHLVVSVSGGMADVYSQLITQKPSSTPSQQVGINQHWALQLLFDVKFILHIFPRKDDSKDSKQYQSKMEKVISSLEEKIDPFDLDVFSPYVQANLTKLTQRASVLLGGLTSIDKSGFYSVPPRASAGTQQEQHNVLLLSSCQSRFSLLPLSSTHSRYQTPQPVMSQTLYRGVETTGPSLAETAAAVLPHHSQQKLASSSSFYDKMTGLGSMSELSSWFSNIGK